MEGSPRGEARLGHGGAKEDLILTTDCADHTDGEQVRPSFIRDIRVIRGYSGVPRPGPLISLRIRRQVAVEDGLVARSTRSIRVFRGQAN